MGAVRQFVIFFGGLGVSLVALKSMDRLLYSLDETREERLKANELHHRALQVQAQMLRELQAQQ
jgi:hypothetical protein